MTLQRILLGAASFKKGLQAGDTVLLDNFTGTNNTAVHGTTPEIAPTGSGSWAQRLNNQTNVFATNIFGESSVLKPVTEDISSIRIGLGSELGLGTTVPRYRVTTRFLWGNSNLIITNGNGGFFGFNNSTALFNGQPNFFPSSNTSGMWIGARDTWLRPQIQRSPSSITTLTSEQANPRYTLNFSEWYVYSFDMDGSQLSNFVVKNPNGTTLYTYAGPDTLAFYPGLAGSPVYLMLANLPSFGGTSPNYFDYVQITVL